MYTCLLSFRFKAHTRTVVRECYKDDRSSLWEMGKFDPRHAHTPDRPTTLLAWLLHGQTNQCAKFRLKNYLRGFVFIPAGLRTFSVFSAYFCFQPNVTIFSGKFPEPGKSWKMTLVLESPGNLLARSRNVLKFARQWCAWQFLVSNRHVYAFENSRNCCHQVRLLGCRYTKNAFTAGVPSRTTLAELTALSQTP